MKRKIRKLGGAGILTLDDIATFTKAQKRIFALMRDGKWYTASRIIFASRQREGLRRMRQLRSVGLIIEKKRITTPSLPGREFAYRIKI